MELKHGEQWHRHLHAIKSSCAQGDPSSSFQSILAALQSAQSLQEWDERIEWHIYSVADDLCAEGNFDAALQLYKMLMQTKNKIVGADSSGLSLERLAIKQIENARHKVESRSQSEAGFPNLAYLPVGSKHQRHEIIGSLLQKFRAWAKRRIA
jgi:hypothetical protein